MSALHHSMLAFAASAGLLGLVPASIECKADEPAIGSAPAVDVRAPGQEPGTQISNPKGTCLVLSGVKDKIIENLAIGPCGGHGIELLDSRNVTIRNVVITDTVESGIYIAGSTSVEVTESRISNGVSGVYALDSSGIRVTCNTIEDPRGPIPRGQLVQFDKVTGADNQISCNAGRNRPGRGIPEDAISLYKSHGTAGSPIAVTYNVIVGGGPSESGGGIMLGDDGGSHQIARGNILVDPGQYGIAVSSGRHMSIVENMVLSRKLPFTNVGISVWNQYPHACNTISVERNKVKWQSKTGRANPFWDGENCGGIKGLRSNNFAAQLSPDIAELKAPECQCINEGRR